VTTILQPDLAATVSAMAPEIRAACADLDATRALPADVVRDLRDLGVFRQLTPTEVGGAESDPMRFVELVETASYVDGSVGWCVMIAGCFATLGGLLPPAGARDVFGDPATIVAGSLRPVGQAVEVPGGYRVTGRWPLASGSTHATWFMAGAVVMRDGEPLLQPSGAPRMRELSFPADEVEIVDTWDSTGLRGTASHDIAVDDVFVPADRTAWFQDPPALARPLYVMPTIATFATYIAAVPLGIARHALEEFVELADAKQTTWSQSSVADKPVVQDRLGRAHAEVAAARVYLLDQLGALWTKVERGDAPTMADRGTLWLASTHAAEAAVEAVEALYVSAGAASVYSRCALDRCLRDARTAAQHICTQEVNYELAGKALLGRPVLPSAWMLDYRGEG
jgi:alkylation response protein AidB-like acyl-CoA dehydrogenase